MFKIGTLVQINNTFTGSFDGATGVITERGLHHDGDWKYLIFFAHNGEYGWWTDTYLVELCSK